MMLALVPMAMTKAEPPPLPPKGRLVIRELWRVSAPNARLIIVVPKRRGMWSAADNTPFDRQGAQGRVLGLWKGGVSLSA